MNTELAEAAAWRDRLQAGADALNALGIEAEVPDQSSCSPPAPGRLVLNVRGICVDEFVDDKLRDWVSIELRHL